MPKKNPLVRVEGSNSLYRTQTGSIVNTDDASFNAYIKKRNSHKFQSEQITSLTSQLLDARNEIEELKELVKKALEIKGS
jgi:hypothetical protein